MGVHFADAATDAETFSIAEMAAPGVTVTGAERTVDAPGVTVTGAERTVDAVTVVARTTEGRSRATARCLSVRRDGVTAAVERRDRAECAPAAGPDEFPFAEDADAEPVDPESASAAATPAPERMAAPIPSATTAPPVHPP